jgi:hypothetical protein
MLVVCGGRTRFCIAGISEAGLVQWWDGNLATIEHLDPDKFSHATLLRALEIWLREAAEIDEKLLAWRDLLEGDPIP